MKRITRQRKAILDAFQKSERPLSVEEIVESSKINLSTAYRNLKFLLDEGKIISIDLPGNPPRYELFKERHHHYFLCQQCDKLYEIPGCPDGISAIVPEGFTMISHSLTLHGYCVGCTQTLIAIQTC